jgi:AcrR family transcriptional regulator
MVNAKKASQRKTSLERQEEIIQAAFNVVSLYGLKGLTTSKLAAELDFSEANIYRHFKNNNEIIEKMIDTIGNGLLGNLEQVKQEYEEGVEALHNLFIRHLKFIEKTRGVPRLVFSDGVHAGNPELKKKLLKIITSYGEGIKKLVVKAQDNGCFCQGIAPQDVVTTLLGWTQVLALKWSLSNYSFSLEKEGERMWKNCLNIIPQ